MTLTTLSDLETYMGTAAFAAWQAAQADAQRTLDRTEGRLLAAILPNSPKPANAAAFVRAVCAQIAHDAEPRSRELAGLPEGVTAFSVNGFSASLDAKRGDITGEAGLCRDARAALLTAGLLCRSVKC